MLLVLIVLFKITMGSPKNFF